MYTLMHISDLHRSEANPISNDELLSSLAADCQKFSAEKPPISLPNAIVVSGDLVFGLPLHSPNYPEALKKQYSDAFKLLVRLADTFVEGDCSKVIIVPGNHDVDWNKAYSAMKIASQSGENIQKLLLDPNSPYRWSWEDRQLFRIDNYDVYEERFKFFYDFYSRFYDGANVDFQLDPKQPWNLFKLDQGRILVCAFTSCVNTDCFNLFGEIPALAIAQSHLAYSGDCRLRIAVWHHDIQGVPRRSDYLDPDTVQLMIDKGYRLGMHGHRHKSDALPFSLHTTPEMHTMVVVGAGSLCAGLKQLPHGLNRQYNIIEISDDYTHARVHIREMSVPGIFAPGRLVALGSLSYADLRWTPLPPSALVNTGRGGGPEIAIIEHVESLISNQFYDDAISQIETAGDKLGHYGRQLLSEALFRAKRWERLEKHLSHPRNSDELTKLVLAAIALKHWEEADRALIAAAESEQFPTILLQDLRNRLTAEKGMSR